MKQKGIWLRKGLALYHLAPSELALALLVREKPLTAQQLSAALTEKGTRLDRKQLGKILAKLERAGAVETAAGKYICQNETILHYPTTYSESQLLDIIGMTQNTVNGQAVFYEHQLPWQQRGLKQDIIKQAPCSRFGNAALTVYFRRNQLLYARVLISSVTFAMNSSTSIVVVSPLRSRTERLPASASFAPRTSM